MNTGIAASFLSFNEKRKQVNSDPYTLQADELTALIRRCSLNDRDSQKKIYTTFFSFSMAICNRYVNNCDDAVEIVNDGFLKIFRDIARYEPTYADVVSSFRGWVRKIMEHSAIDHFRRNKRHRFAADINNGVIQVADKREDALDKISYQEILHSARELTPVYRRVLNLFIVEGWTHQEIATELGISVGTSKSNLAKARIQLQKILFRRNDIPVTEKHPGIDLCMQ